MYRSIVGFRKNTPEEKDGAAKFFEECLNAVREFIDNEVQPIFDKEKDLDGAKRFYIDVIDNCGSDFIRKRNLRMNIAQMKIVCRYFFENKILSKRIQASMVNSEGLERMQQRGE